MALDMTVESNITIIRIIEMIKIITMLNNAMEITTINVEAAAAAEEEEVIIITVSEKQSEEICFRQFLTPKILCT